jgi:hypothetical protein
MSDVDIANYNVDDIAEQARIREADRLYDNLDYNVSFFSTLEEAITILGGMRDPSKSKLFEKIDRIAREDVHKWKKSACNQALLGIDRFHHKRYKKT